VVTPSTSPVRTQEAIFRVSALSMKIFISYFFDQYI
jgi:hypothetical protein